MDMYSTIADRAWAERFRACVKKRVLNKYELYFNIVQKATSTATDLDEIYRQIQCMQSFENKVQGVGVPFLSVFFQSSSATTRSLKIGESYAEAAFLVAIHDDYGQFYLKIGGK